MDPSAFLAQEMAATWQWRIDTDPELAAGLGLLAKRRSTHALDPRSPKSFEDRLQWMKRAQTRIQEGLTRQQIESLSPEDQLSYKLYLSQISDYVEYTKKHKAYLCCVNRLEGPQSDLPLYARYLPTKTRANREFYRDFLKAIPLQLAEVTSLLELGLKEKRTPPNVSLDGVVEQIREMVKDGMPAFSDPIRDACFEAALEAECRGLIDKDASQAFSEFGDFLEQSYIPHLRTENSATKGYPNGEEYYRDCLAFHTTTKMTPREVHQLGLDEVARIRAEMNEIATEAGYAGRLEEYMEHLRTSKDYEPESGAALCSHFRDITGRIAPQLLKLFHLKTLPKCPFEIVEVPAAHASMAPAAYYLAGSSDPATPRPGVFYVNTSELSTRRTYECESLALHEAIPGHHTQAAVQGESLALPDFRRYQEDRRYFEAPCRFPFYTGYIEGWGLHCETLGKELGIYNRTEARFGQLSMEALRSCRLVVDTGMHSFGWSLDDAYQYMLKNTAMGEHDAMTEVKRYATWPGQATAYKVGERFIHRLRQKAAIELGAGFDPRDFYHIVLTAGPVPLNMLEEEIDHYIAESKSKQGQAGTRTAVADQQTSDLMATMTFANWCKCCVVPGSCSSP